MAVAPEIAFPYATGAILLIGIAIIAYIYRKLGNPALLVLMIGLFSVAMESFLDGYEAQQLLPYGASWNNVPTERIGYMLTIDVIRGIWIIIWAAMEFMFAFMLGGTENKKLLYGLPAAVLIFGTAETVYFDLYYGANTLDLETRIFVSSAIRVLVFLVPAALFAGAYILYNLYRELATKSSLLYGLGFIIHGLTLPFYSISKEHGSITLGLWYALGGVIPALLATLGSYYLMKEATEELIEEEEEGETEESA
ncbi:MAG: hypothetical protein F7C35_07970 [Desulfurococcales archaeon]|nr:hypothetical protein [Desulfurococcales archaeon]